MLDALTLIFGCQLVGELIVAALGLPVPGPVIGMLLLLSGLLFRGAVPDELGQVADTFAANLSLLFVPAGVGIMLHMDLISRNWMPLVVALIVSTALAMAVTGVLMQRLVKALTEDDT
jgi:holin-like protein